MVFPPRKQIVVPPSKITARTHDEIARQAPNHLATPVTGFKHVKHRVAKRGHIRGRGGSERLFGPASASGRSKQALENQSGTTPRMGSSVPLLADQPAQLALAADSTLGLVVRPDAH